MAMLFEEAVRLADLKSVAIGSFLRGQNWWVSHMQSAKAAITTMSHTMAKEWAEYGIRVCNVAPVSTHRIPSSLLLPISSMLVAQGAIADTPANLKQGSGEGQTATASELSPDGIPVAPHVPLGRMGTCASPLSSCLHMSSTLC